MGEQAVNSEQPPVARDASLGELVKQLSEQVLVLVRDELKLAQLEMTRKGRQAGLGAGMLDPEELRHEIERTREQLGETMQALAAKTDVKARAQDKAAQLAGRLKSMTAQARQQAAVQAGQLQRQLAGKTAGPRQKAASVSGPAKDQVRQQAAAAAAKISKITPEPLHRGAAQAAGTARQLRAPLAAAIGAALGAWLVIAWWRRR